jgi:hypothetical protein
MKTLVDVVNFNSDASCLPCRNWLEALQGGDSSRLMQWLKLYVDFGKKLVLGFTGATVADMARHNPEAIDYINEHPNLFELVLRPFAHDIALLRQGIGFRLNLEWGRRAIEREFNNVLHYFLPPEFMLTNEQVTYLSEQAVAGVFINASRFSSEIRTRIPTVPYTLRGLFDVPLNCIPLEGRLTEGYLHALQSFDCSSWNAGIQTAEQEAIFSWRDGESAFLLPDGVVREAFWLKNEQGGFHRTHIADLSLQFRPSTLLEEHQYRTYPVHSFSAWMKEFRMLGFVHRMQRIEERLSQLTAEQIHYWLMIINSDILSAIEKRSPLILLKATPESIVGVDFTIRRSERGFEGEEYLAILESALDGRPLTKYVAASTMPHVVKWRGRIEYLNELQVSSQ